MKEEKKFKTDTLRDREKRSEHFLHSWENATKEKEQRNAMLMEQMLEEFLSFLVQDSHDMEARKTQKSECEDVEEKGKGGSQLLLKQQRNRKSKRISDISTLLYLLQCCNPILNSVNKQYLSFLFNT